MLEAVKFTPETIAGLVGIGLTLIFNYFPKLREKYAGLASEVKSYIMLGLLLTAEIIICLLSYYSVITTDPPFSWVTALNVAFALLVSNQGAYTILPQPTIVKEIIVLRDVQVAEEVVANPPVVPV